MRPEVVNLFGFLPIHSYGLMIVIGFLVLLFVGAREVRRRGLPDHFTDLAIAMLLCGIAGGRIFYYIQFYETSYADKPFWEIFQIWKGGLVFYGGLIGGLIGGLVFLCRKKLPIRDYLDVISMVAPIGMGFGRFGCFFNGCCYGRLCSQDFPLAVVFPPTSPAATKHLDVELIQSGEEALAVHPVQLYQATHDFLAFFLIWIFLRWTSPPKGAGVPFFLVIYGIGRFFLEGLRADNNPTWGGLTISQNISLALVTVFGVLLVAMYWKARRVTSRCTG